MILDDDFEKRVEAELARTALPGSPLELPYKNWRGEIATRKIQPMRLVFASTDWHPEPQWLLIAWDIEKDAERSFALKDFDPAPEPEAEVGMGSALKALRENQRQLDADGSEVGVSREALTLLLEAYDRGRRTIYHQLGTITELRRARIGDAEKAGAYLRRAEKAEAAIAALSTDAEPVMYVSEQQLAKCVGHYVPSRKEAEGNFQLALYRAPPAPSVAVKALEWELRSYNSGRHNQYIARSIVGNYAITDLSVLGWFEWLNRSCGPVGKAKTLEEAKAAAQADYESRIRSALSAQVQDVAAPDTTSSNLRDRIISALKDCEGVTTPGIIADEVLAAIKDGGA